MVSGYSDAGQVAWLDGKGIELIRGDGRIAGPHRVSAGGREHTAEHIVVATGSAPFMPPIPGLRDLDGVWTNREATGLRELPRRLLVLGGGPVGVELAQALTRLGVSVALVEGAEHVLPREPRPLGDALAHGAARPTAWSWRWAGTRAPRGATATTTCSSSPTARSCAATACSSPPAAAPARTGSGSRRSGSSPGGPASRSTPAWPPPTGVWAIGDVTGVWPLTYVGKYQGRVAAANILGRAAEANYDAVPRVVFTDPQAAAVGEPDGELTATVPMSEVARTATYTRAYAERPGFLTLVSDGERLTGAYALGPEAGEWLQQATLAIRARVPLELMRDTIQPFPTFSEAYLHALAALPANVTAGV